MLNLVHLKVLAAVARHGSVTEAARELHYSQPSVSHHLSRLEAATGVKLVQRIGRGIRLTPEGRLLANRAAEIVGRVDAATNELAAQVGLQAGRVRLAANASALSTIVPKAAATLAQAYPGIELSLIDRHPVEALQMLRHGEIDVALVFRYADAPVEDEGFRLLHIGDDDQPGHDSTAGVLASSKCLVGAVRFDKALNRLQLVREGGGSPLRLFAVAVVKVDPYLKRHDTTIGEAMSVHL
jgi:DNA-binding transcriptional LysR family regulator